MFFKTFFKFVHILLDFVLPIAKRQHSNEKTRAFFFCSCCVWHNLAADLVQNPSGVHTSAMTITLFSLSFISPILTIIITEVPMKIYHKISGEILFAVYVFFSFSKLQPQIFMATAANDANKKLPTLEMLIPQK